MAQDKDISADMDFDSQNIFDEFSESQEIGEEVRKIEEKQKKDTYYYLKRFSSFIFIINAIVFIWMCLSVAYIYIQTNTEKKEYSFLSPVCGVFLWDVDVSNNTCYGINPILEEYTGLLWSERQKQLDLIVPLLWEVYSIENFNLSKKVSFLLEKTNSRVKPLEILSAFDEIKTAFAPRDKLEISCYNITITSDNVLDISCDIFSPDWDTQIINFEDGWIKDVEGGGTSISKAGSFMSFIESLPGSPFIVLSSPKFLSSQGAELSPYTQKTTIQLRLQYNDNKLSN